MPKRLAKSRERRKKPHKGVKWFGATATTKESPSPPHSFFFVGTSKSFRLMRKSGPFPAFVVSFVFALGCRPKGTKGTTPAVLLRVQTPPPTSRFLRRGFQTTMSGATEESVVPAALWSRVDAAPKVRTMMIRCSFWMMMMMGSTSSPPPFGMGDASPFSLSLSLSLSLFLSLVESENERTKRRQKPSSLAHSCAVFIVVVVALIDGVLFTSSPFLLLLETHNQHRTQS